MVAAAIGLGATVIGGATSVISGNKAANATEAASKDSNALQKYIFDTTRSDYEPWKQVGQGALGKLAGLYGISSGLPGAPGSVDWGAYVRGNPDAMANWNVVRGSQYDTFGGDINKFGQYHYQADGAHRDLSPYTVASNDNGSLAGEFYKSPDYRFGLDEGTKAIERSAAARGGLVSGATAKALDRYASDYASGQYQNYVSRLMALAGFGTQATGATAAAGQNYAGSVSANNMNAGNARASAYQNTGAAINNGVTNLASMYLYQKGAGGFNPYAAGHEFGPGG